MEHKLKTTLFFTSLFLSVTILAAGSAMAAKVYRWVDENGEVHYSETLPPDFEDKKHDELDDQGIVRAKDQSLVPLPPEAKTEEIDPDELPRDSSGLKRSKRMYTDEQLQSRMDAFLLLRYGSEQEIQNAMTVEINQLEYDRLLLQTSRESMAVAFRGHIREAAARQRSGVEVDAESIKSITSLQSRLKSYGDSLVKLQEREDKIIANFGDELERYRYLINNEPEES